MRRFYTYFTLAGLFSLVSLFPLTPQAAGRDRQTLVPERKLEDIDFNQELTKVAGYDGSLYIQSYDQNVRFNIDGSFQPMYRASSKAKDGSPANHTLLIRRAGTTFKTILMEKLYFQLGLYHSTQSETFKTVNITGTKGGYRFSPEFNVEMGMVGIPLDQSYGTFLTQDPITATQFDQVEKATVGRSSFGGPAGIGVSFFGKSGIITYKTNVINASQSNYELNPNWALSGGGQLGIHILDEKENALGLDWNIGGLFEAPADDTKVTPPAHIDGVVQGSTGFGLNYGPLSFGLEGYLKKINIATVGGAKVETPGQKIDIGYYAGLGYFVIPDKLQLACQFAQMVREGPANNSWGAGIGANWHLIAKHLQARTGYYLTRSYDLLRGAYLQSEHQLELGLEAEF